MSSVWKKGIKGTISDLRQQGRALLEMQAKLLNEVKSSHLEIQQKILRERTFRKSLEQFGRILNRTLKVEKGIANKHFGNLRGNISGMLFDGGLNTLSAVGGQWFANNFTGLDGLEDSDLGIAFLFGMVAGPITRKAEITSVDFNRKNHYNTKGFHEYRNTLKSTRFQIAVNAPLGASLNAGQYFASQYFATDRDRSIDPNAVFWNAVGGVGSGVGSPAIGALAEDTRIFKPGSGRSRVLKPVGTIVGKVLISGSGAGLLPNVGNYINTLQDSQNPNGS